MQWNEFRSHIRHLPTKDLERVERAFELGKEMHEGQKRRSGKPYFDHCIAVADMLADMGADADTIIAALLHDTIEDTPLTLKDVEKEFGKTVAALVDGATKLRKEDIAKKPTLDERVETLRKIFTLMQQDVRIMVIKIVDRLHNMQTIEFLSKEKQKIMARQTLDVYVKIADRLCMQDLHDELEALCLGILEPGLFKKLFTLRVENEKSGQKIIQKISASIHGSHPSLSNNINVQNENKPWQKLRAQLEREGTAITGVSSLTAVFVCKDVETCYRVFGALHQNWQRETLSFEDFINSPMINGYQGLNTTVILEDGTRVRCKIRTEEMHAYARKGVTTKCFDSEATGLLDYLPWAEHIPTLAEDTANRSAQFWESLQSDILGESIVIHGPNDRAISLPKGATALDGALYFFPSRALRTTSIRVNGKNVAFSTPLEHAASLDLELASHRTVQREWLKWVNTGLAIAEIRGALAAQSEETKLSTGKQMLQAVMEEQKKGYIEEFDEERILEGVRSIGYESLEDLYRAIADGHVEPSEASAAIFEMKNGLHPEHARPYRVQYSYALDDFDTVTQLLKLYKQYKAYRRKLRIGFNPLKRMGTATLYLSLTPEKQRALLAALQTTGAKDVRWGLVSSYRIGATLTAALILLWGLDPIVAKAILNAGVTPVSFTVIRCLVLAVFSLLVLLCAKRSRTLSRIPLNYSSLWIAGIAFFLVSLFTYFALASVSPITYNTVLRGTAVLLATPLFWRHRSYKELTAVWLLTFGAFALIIFSQESLLGFALSICALAFFGIYTAASTRFQLTAKILARYPEFFFTISVITALMAVFLSVFAPVSLPSNPLLILTIVYTICFIGIPYLIFYSITRHIGYSALSPWINVTLIVTFIGQAVIFGFENMLILIPAAILLVLASLYSSQKAVFVTSTKE